MGRQGTKRYYPAAAPPTMTCKLVLFSPRAEGTSHEACLDYVENERVPWVRRLPGLMEYKTAVPLDPDESGYDLMEQIWFNDEESMETALASEVWERVERDAEGTLATDDAVAVPVVDEQVH